MKYFFHKRLIIPVLICIVMITLLSYYFYQSIQNKESLTRLNDSLIMDDIKLYLKEEQIINLLGEGEYIEGFGGHIRDYKNLEISIGFSEDSDNDFYGRVSLVEISNPIYSIYGIKIGDSKQESINKLKSKGYEQLVEDQYINSEYIISIHGEPQVQMIQIWFSDKDLRDRNY